MKNGINAVEPRNYVLQQPGRQNTERLQTVLTLKLAQNPIEISFIHGKRTVYLVFTQALKGFLKAQQWPGTKRTHYLLYIKQIYNL